MYNDQTEFPRYLYLGLFYINNNGEIAYYSSWLSIVFTFNILISKGFTSLVFTLEIFKAPHWQNFPAIKLINNHNIKTLFKSKKQNMAKHFSFLDRIIIGFKKCSFSIVMGLIIHKIKENQWFNKRVINKLPLVVYQDCYIKNNLIFKLYI